MREIILFKTRIVIFTIVLVFLIFGKLWNSRKSNEKVFGGSVKVASFYNKSSKFIDPIRFESATDYNLARNLYSQLVEYDENGSIIPGAPESFHWEGQNLIFTFGNKTRTNKGNLITANDAAKSLKRTLFLEKYNHGSLKSILCKNGGNNSKFEGVCDGIHVDGNKLILTVKENIPAEHVIEVLSSIDFSIIPNLPDQIDKLKDSKLDHSETSGPYFVSQDDENGNFTFKASEQHYNYSKDIPQVVQFVSTKLSTDHGAMLLSGEVDFTTTTCYISIQSLAQIMNDRSTFSVHETVPIRVHMVVFTPVAVKKFSYEHRAFAASLFKEFYLSRIKEPERKESHEFFQTLSDGSLSAEQKLVIEKLRSNPDRPKFDQPIQYGIPESRYEDAKNFFAPYPEVEVVKRTTTAMNYPVEERSDMYFVTNDSAWTESITLVNYNFNNGIFNIPNFDYHKWIDNYMGIKERSERVKMLSDLHFKLLQTGGIFPLFVSPYYAVARKPWEIKMSTLFAGTPLWQIHKKQ